MSESGELFAGTVHAISPQEREVQKQIESAATHYYLTKDPKAKEHWHRQLLRLRAARQAIRQATVEGKLIP